MLFTPDGKQITRKLLYPQKYNPVRARIPVAAFERIKETLRQRVGPADQPPHRGDEQIVTSSWVPGENWDGTPYVPIYDAAQHNQQLAGQIFGIILWQVMFEHPQPWGFGRYELDGIPIEGLTYFRVDPPRPPTIGAMRQQLRTRFGGNP